MVSPSSTSIVLTANDTPKLIEEANKLTFVQPYREVADKINLVLDVLKIRENFGRDYEDNRVKIDLTYSLKEPHYKLSIIIKEKIDNNMATDYSSFTGAKVTLLSQTDIKKMLADLKKNR